MLIHRQRQPMNIFVCCHIFDVPIWIRPTRDAMRGERASRSFPTRGSRTTFPLNMLSDFRTSTEMGGTFVTVLSLRSGYVYFMILVQIFLSVFMPLWPPEATSTFHDKYHFSTFQPNWSFSCMDGISNCRANGPNPDSKQIRINNPKKKCRQRCRTDYFFTLSRLQIVTFL